MLNFGKGGYGLGVGYFRSALDGGVQAVGHMGSNIGTTASMVYSRQYGVNLVVMINAYHLECIGELTERVGEITLDFLEFRIRRARERQRHRGGVKRRRVSEYQNPSRCPEQDLNLHDLAATSS